MEIRRICLWVMLAALAGAAGAGVLLVLTGGSDALARLAWTALMLAIAAGLMMRATPLLDKPAMRPAGVTAAGALLFLFLYASAMVWEALPMRSETGLLLLWTALAAPAAVLSLMLAGTENGRFAGRVGVGFTAAALVMMLLGTFLRDRWTYSPVNERWLTTGGLTALFGVFAVANTVRIDFADGRLLRMVGLVGAALGWVVSMAAVWFWESTGSRGAVAITLPDSAALLAGLANVLYLCDLTPGQAWVRLATIATAGLSLFALNAVVPTGLIDRELEVFARIIGAGGIVTLCGSLAVPIMARLNRRTEKEPVAAAEFRELSATCPMCGTAQKLPTGGAQCIECGLRFVIQIVEPRCPKCDYLLYRIKSDRCPECGLPLHAPA
jgi:hypothetical protein